MQSATSINTRLVLRIYAWTVLPICLVLSDYPLFIPAVAADVNLPGAAMLTGVAADGGDVTPRETDVLRHLALGVENRAQATVQALKRGLVSLEDLE